MPSSIHLERLYDEHAPPLFAFLLSHTRNEADTRDLLQEIFRKLAARPELLDGVVSVRAFLIRMAHNLSVDLIRRRSTRQENYDQLAGDSTGLFAPGSSPDEQTFRKALSDAMGALPEDQRAVVHLKLWEGLTFETIAEALEIPANTAASRYRYAIDKLRERLRPLYEDIQNEP